MERRFKKEESLSLTDVVSQIKDDNMRAEMLKQVNNMNKLDSDERARRQTIIEEFPYLISGKIPKIYVRNFHKHNNSKEINKIHLQFLDVILKAINGQISKHYSGNNKTRKAITNTLSNAFRTGGIKDAFLLVGQPGTGKTWLSIQMARYLCFMDSLNYFLKAIDWYVLENTIAPYIYSKLTGKQSEQLGYYLRKYKRFSNGKPLMLNANNCFKAMVYMLYDQLIEEALKISDKYHEDYVAVIPLSSLRDGSLLGDKAVYVGSEPGPIFQALLRKVKYRNTHYVREALENYLAKLRDNHGMVALYLEDDEKISYIESEHFMRSMCILCCDEVDKMNNRYGQNDSGQIVNIYNESDGYFFDKTAKIRIPIDILLFIFTCNTKDPLNAAFINRMSSHAISALSNKKKLIEARRIAQTAIKRENFENVLKVSDKLLLHLVTAISKYDTGMRKLKKVIRHIISEYIVEYQGKIFDKINKIEQAEKRGLKPLKKPLIIGMQYFQKRGSLDVNAIITNSKEESKKKVYPIGTIDAVLFDTEGNLYQTTIKAAQALNSFSGDSRAQIIWQGISSLPDMNHRRADNSSSLYHRHYNAIINPSLSSNSELKNLFLDYICSVSYDKKGHQLHARWGNVLCLLTYLILLSIKKAQSIPKNIAIVGGLSLDYRHSIEIVPSDLEAYIKLTVANNDQIDTLVLPKLSPTVIKRIKRIIPKNIKIITIETLDEIERIVFSE